jgi:hypothetical protein
VLLVIALSFLMRSARRFFFPSPPIDPGQPLDAVRIIISRILSFVAVGLAAVIMARIEREKWEHYGLPWRRAVSFDFGFGLVWGFVSLTIVMGAMWLAGAYHVDGFAMAGTQIWKQGLLWGVAFLFVGLLEEFTLRGYTQYTLASGMGFWPSAVLLSGVFFAGHLNNPGENWMGLTDVFVAGMFLCLTLWRTGDLWFAVGLHASWDWGLTYFFSVPNSGTVAVGHLLNVRTVGPD